VVAVPYVAERGAAKRSFATEAEFLREYASEFWVVFPEGTRFHVDPQKYDVYVDWPYTHAREAYPVAISPVREEQARVPKGWTQQEAGARGVDPRSIKLRILKAQGKISSFRECRGGAPNYPRPEEYWYGPIRHKLDDAYVDLWSTPFEQIAKFKREVSDFMAETVRFPITDGTLLYWKDRREHPFQKVLGSSTVINYKRFVYSLADPGYIVGVYKALKEYFLALDSQNGGPTYTTITHHEVFDFNEDLPEE
jgi:hypothetical protein